MLKPFLPRSICAAIFLLAVCAATPLLGQNAGDENEDLDKTLINAAEASDTAAARRAIQFGAYLETRNSKGQTPLLIAIQAGNTELVGLLLEQGANHTEKLADGSSLLHRAAALPTSSAPEITTLLLSAGHPADPSDSKGNTPLIVASQSGNSAVVEALLKAGAVKDHKNSDGKTALDVAKNAEVKATLKPGASKDTSATASANKVEAPVTKQ